MYIYTDKTTQQLIMSFSAESELAICSLLFSGRAEWTNTDVADRTAVATALWKP